MNLEDIINELDEMVLNGMALPMTNGKCVINREKVKELIQDLRLNLPNEIHQAKAIVADRNEIITKAREEAESIVAQARAQAEQMVQENEITQMATEKATVMLSNAQARAKDLRTTASNYTEDILTHMEEYLQKSLNDVQTTRQYIQNADR